MASGHRSADAIHRHLRGDLLAEAPEEKPRVAELSQSELYYELELPLVTPDANAAAKNLYCPEALLAETTNAENWSLGRTPCDRIWWPSRTCCIS